VTQYLEAMRAVSISLSTEKNIITTLTTSRHGASNENKKPTKIRESHQNRPILGLFRLGYTCPTNHDTRITTHKNKQTIDDKK